MNLMSDSASYFYGVVENNQDPLMQGRVQVRVLGAHSFKRTQDDVDGIAVADLPWMNVTMPVTSATISGIGSSPVGLLNGSHVFGWWLDKYKTNGIVTGSLTGYFAEVPNPDEGFSDPSGTYPTSAGSTTGNLALGGTTGINDNSNVNQNGQSVIGLNPTAIPGGGAPSSLYNESLSEKMIAQEEGRKTTIYQDRSGWSIGIGHLCIQSGTRVQGIQALNSQLGRSTGGVITSSEIDKLFKSDLARVRSGIQSHPTVGPVYNAMNGSRRMAIENMVFQMGIGGVAKFTSALGHMRSGQWEIAAKELMSSAWAGQTAGRAARVSSIIKYGNLSSYGLSDTKSSSDTLKPVASPLSRMLVSSFAINSFNPDSSVTTVPDTDIPTMPSYVQPTPLVDKNGVLNGVTEDFWSGDKPSLGEALFQQPPSSYQGKYPHVKVDTTPGGHINEVDDTPGNERTRTVHPSGTYREINPQGMIIEKSKSDMYKMSEGDMNNYCAGDYKVNISGVEIYYNLGDKTLQVNGNQLNNITGTYTRNVTQDQTIYVKGNETKTIDGNGTIRVKGNITIVVEGDADITVNGDATQTINGNTNQTVGGSVTQNVSGNFNSNVSGTYTVSAGGGISLVSNGVATIKGSRINFGG